MSPTFAQTFVPQTLYHYTRAEGVVGILQTSQVWATRVQYLNDGKELGHAFDVALQVLPEIEDRNPGGVAAFRSSLVQGYHSAIIYVASFSAAEDQLSQWRAYGRIGDAYSLGFRGDFIAEAARSSGWKLMPCVYDYTEQRILVRATLERFIDRFERGEAVDPTDTDPDPNSLFQRYCYGALVEVAPLLKHHGFAEEREWRLISPIDAPGFKVWHRPSSQSLVPFVRFPLLVAGELSLDSITVGPGFRDPSTASDAVWSLLRSEGALPSVVRISQIPYRG